MKLFPSLEERYSRERLTALEAQRQAQEIAFAPIAFQISRLMVKFGILELLADSREGLTQREIRERCPRKLTDYAVQVLLEASLSIGTVLVQGDRYVLSKTGWFLQNDRLVRANLDFNHDVNYLGMFHLEEALVNGKPEGLKVFGAWPTIYEGLSALPPHVQESWFGFDHFYSDASFTDALRIVFGDAARPVRRLLDVGGNTGRFALRCVGHDPDVEVTIMDLPQQLDMMRAQIAGHPGAERVHGHGANLLDPAVPFPGPAFDAIWMSQFLDCFSEDEVKSILSRAAASMDAHTSLYIMETLWDRQRFETAAYCLTLTSPYFTAMANGNSKMFHSDDLIGCVEAAGLKVRAIHDGLGLGHAIVACGKE